MERLRGAIKKIALLCDFKAYQNYDFLFVDSSERAAGPKTVQRFNIFCVKNYYSARFYITVYVKY